MDEKLNFLIIMSDQHHPRISGFAGDEVARTPNLDSLASEGICFQRAYCQAPLCVPSRMSFLTARQPSDIRVWTNSCILSSDTATFAHCLGASGYETTLIGRMHFVGPDQHHGFEKRLVGSLTAVHISGRPPELTTELLSATGQGRQSVLVAGPGRTAYQVYDETVARATAEYLREKARLSDRPFCIVAGFVLPHCPFVCPEDDWKYYYDRVGVPRFPEGYLDNQHPVVKLWRKNRKVDDLTEEQIRLARTGYYGIVTHLDRLLGQIFETLRETGLDKNTLVIYTSDHGEMAGEHGLWCKSNFYEGSVSVPLIFSCPERFPQGVKRQEIVSLLDIAPTLLELAGAEPIPASTGRSLLPLLSTDNTQWNGEAFSEHPPIYGGPYARMLRRGRWKLVYYQDYRPQLFDLESDPDEFNDLGDDPAYQTVRRELLERVLERWSPQEVERELSRRRLNHPILTKWYREVNPPDTGQWNAPPNSNRFPL